VSTDVHCSLADSNGKFERILQTYQLHRLKLLCSHALCLCDLIFVRHVGSNYGVSSGGLEGRDCGQILSSGEIHDEIQSK
jgi:hypothetical protein